MIYIIDKDITFNTENGSLKSITKGREVFLSSVNTRVFKCLLEHSHEAVSRETLLRQVWTDHGLSASSATLNQYICLTRRALASVGFNERLIVTLSKKGYRLNRIIPINRQPVDFPEPPETAEAPVSPVTEPPKQPLSFYFAAQLIDRRAFVLLGAVLHLLQAPPRRRKKAGAVVSWQH